MSVSGAEPKDALRERIANALYTHDYLPLPWTTLEEAPDDFSEIYEGRADAVLVELRAYLNEHRDEMEAAMWSSK